MAAEGRVTVLLVDDEPAILLLLGRLLRDEEMDVLLAHSGQQGLELLREHPEIGVIVSDLKMPEMDGVRFLEQAKERAPMAIRIILTGYADLKTTIEAINQGGASLFLAKPWEEQQLRCTLREAARTFLMRRENEELLATVHRQNEELSSWNQRLEGRVMEQYAQIRQQTEQLQARSDALQKHTEEFHAILNGIPDSLLHLSVNFEILWANTGAIRRLGQPIEKLLGQTCHNFASAAGDPCPSCPALRVLSSGRIEDARITGGDGRTWGVKAFPLKDGGGNCTGLIVWSSDISEKVVLRAEASKTTRLAALGEMSAGVAHEINNPNAVLLFNLPLIDEAFTDAMAVMDVLAKERDFTLAGLPYAEMRRELPVLLSDCIGSAARIGRIVENVKEFIRPGEGLAERISLNEVAVAAMRLVGTAQARTAGFQCDFDGALPSVSGEPRRLEQVVVNLLENACQALPDGAGQVILATRFDGERRLCILEVHDTGSGIAAAILPRICDPFFTTRRERGGTGLGLSVSSRIVGEHGGRLEFTPRPGGGTIVSLLLPSCPEEAADGR